MSIATLKKKTQSKYNNNSVNTPQFSLNGTYRNQGYIGQTSLSRSLPRSLAIGPVMKGHGGCCGTYPSIPPIVSIYSTENNQVVKPSVLSYSGMIAKKYRWIKGPLPVKPDSWHNQNTQGDYLQYTKNKALAAIKACSSEITCKTINGIASITKPDKVRSQGEYLDTILHTKCMDAIAHEWKKFSHTGQLPKN